MQFSEMKTEVSRRLGSDTTFWTTADIEEALNEGYVEISDATEWYETYDIVGLLSSLTYYDLRFYLGNTFLSPRRAHNQTTNRWLTPCHTRDLDFQTYVQWELVSGEPEKMFMRGLWWWGLFPFKASDAGNIKFYYTAIPDAMSEDADTPAFPREFHLGMVHYALYDLLVQEGETKKALYHWGEYLKKEKALAHYVSSRMSIDRVERYGDNPF